MLKQLNEECYMYKQDYYQAMNEMLAELSDRYIPTNTISHT